MSLPQSRRLDQAVISGVHVALVSIAVEVVVGERQCHRTLVLTYACDGQDVVVVTDYLEGVVHRVTLSLRSVELLRG